MPHLLELMKLAKESVFSKFPPGMPPYVYTDATSATLLQLVLADLQPVLAYLKEAAEYHLPEERQKRTGVADDGLTCRCNGCTVYRELKEKLA